MVQDPTLPPGNLIMIYEAENHCPGGVNQFDYYATAGLARSPDNGQTWPAPIAAEFGGPNRYPALKSSTPEPTTPESPQINLGNAIPSAFIDGNYIYVVYEYVNSPSTMSDALMRIARANLITDNVGGTLQFHKWYNGSFSQPGIGGLDSSPLPSFGCPGIQRQASLTYNDNLGVYMMLFLCNNTSPSGEAAWYYSIATSLDLEDWTPPRQIDRVARPSLESLHGCKLRRRAVRRLVSLLHVTHRPARAHQQDRSGILSQRLPRQHAARVHVSEFHDQRRVQYPRFHRQRL